MEQNCLCREVESTPSLLAFYQKKEDRFQYHQDLVDQCDDCLRDMPFWQYLEEREGLPAKEAERFCYLCHELTLEHGLFCETLFLPRRGRCEFTFICTGNTVTIAIRNTEEWDNGCDALTGLPTRSRFCKEAQSFLEERGGSTFAIYFFDLVKFKVLNDLFGFSEGDRVLRFIANRLQDMEANGVLCACRESADRFVMLADVAGKEPHTLSDILSQFLEGYHIPFELDFHVGIYVTSGTTTESVNSMIDKAIVAQRTIKGKYDRQYCYYTEELREAILTEHEIESSMHAALANGEFINYYQPQYNHSTGMLIGAEALVRWQHPDKGLISPGVFIPLFERNGFITKLDFYVFEQVCKFLRDSKEKGYALVPLSVNFSKNDFYLPDFLEKLEEIRQKYDVDPRYLHLEITESVFMGNHKAVNAILGRLHECGYEVEMDDFGSGFSSLNMLKSLDIDIIKLDMLFLTDHSENNKGGIILASIINMAKWLHLPVIAEGVETVEQAEFLRSLGCQYVQGYLYAKPMSAADYEKIISASQIGIIVPMLTLSGGIDSSRFWDPESQDTLLFNHFSGGAAVFRYDQTAQNVEVLRVNQKYVEEIGMNLSEAEILAQDADNFINTKERDIYFGTLDKAIETMEEQECETWRHFRSACCGDETLCIRSYVQLIGRCDSRFLFFAAIRNVTTERLWTDTIQETAKWLQVIGDQVNFYFWEYNLSTHEMRPCFRCQRDLGLPPLLRNYPESIIEIGFIPSDQADFYRDWMRQLENGASQLEAILPLTPNRIPFWVRYTTEFDENGNPVKAYGSATRVVDNLSNHAGANQSSDPAAETALR